MVDEHGAAGGDGLVHGGAAGFSDDEVVAAEEFGDFAGPSFEVNAAGEVVFDFLGALVEAADVMAEDDGDLGVEPGCFEDSAHDGADVGGAGGGEVENAEGVGGIGGADGGEGLEAGADGEAGDDDFFGGDAAIDE